MKRQSVRVIGYQPGGAFLNGLTHIRYVIASQQKRRLWKKRQDALNVICQLERQETPSHLAGLPDDVKEICASSAYNLAHSKLLRATLKLESLLEDFGFSLPTYQIHVAKCRALGLPITNLPCA